MTMVTVAIPRLVHYIAPRIRTPKNRTKRDLPNT
jgi:hypothetical protein